jgi:hypothetical protein
VRIKYFTVDTTDPEYDVESGFGGSGTAFVSRGTIDGIVSGTRFQLWYQKAMWPEPGEKNGHYNHLINGINRGVNVYDQGSY